MIEQPKTWGCSIEGRLVRLQRVLRLRSGKEFPKGTVLRFSHRTATGLVLRDPLTNGTAARGVLPHLVELLPVDFADAGEPEVQP